MKALVLEQYNQLMYKDVPEPEMGPEDVLIRVRACGICGSDIHGLDGSTGRRIPPVIMGHEAAGVIAEAGSAVRGWKKDDRVTFDSTIYCGKCYFCRRGDINCCDNRRVVGVSCTDYRRDGAFAEYVAVPHHILHRLPGKLSFERAALVEPLSVAFHSVNITPHSLNDSAVVVGTGMVGLLVIQVLRASGLGQIIALDIDADRLALASKMGADRGLLSGSPDVVQQIMRYTENRGADLVFDVVGLATTMKLALQSVRKGGVVTLIGNLAPTVEFPLQTVVTRGVRLLGSLASCGEYPAALEMIERGTINVDALISALVPLSDGAAWFDRLRRRERGLLKVVLTP
ncbi:MAG TPA: galactitol-1-phosphate 5-dehydrogenase [Acidobacteriota bacterium]|nr:galactitol-1-phosphate 5-dehydrogenase [Acidobacteriota bacterium]